MKRLWFILCMGTVCMFGVTSCTQNAELQSKVEVLIDKNADLVEELTQAYEDHKNGDLTTEQLADLVGDIKGNITETKDELVKLKESGVGWGELALSVVLGAAARGIPSKGPLGSLFTMFARRRKEE